jgi:hypothetical protein
MSAGLMMPFWPRRGKNHGNDVLEYPGQTVSPRFVCFFVGTAKACLNCEALPKAHFIDVEIDDPFPFLFNVRYRSKRFGLPSLKWSSSTS